MNAMLVLLLAAPVLGVTAGKTNGTEAAAPLPSVKGWALSQPTRYGPDSLFEYIDGGADAFLRFDFQDLTTADYTSTRGADKVSVTVDIYRHRDARCAFGIYSQERPSNSKPVSVGADSYAGADYLAMVVGPYYVKLVQAGGKDSFLLMLAQKVAEKLPGPREPPAVLKAFPGRGKRPRSEKMAARDFLGYSFLHDGATAAYEIEGARFRLFAVEASDQAEAEKMVERYRAVAKQVGTAAPGTPAMFQDPLNGSLLLQWKGRWLWGAVDGACPSWTALVDELGRNLIGAGP